MSPYSQPKSSYDPAAIAADLHAALTEGLRLFSGVDDALSAERPQPDAWCAREIVGHLIDSACNNHRRWILGQTPGLATFDGYEQNLWVSRNAYADESWADLVALWAAYNRHLRHVIARTPAGHLSLSAMSPDGDGPVSIGFLMQDYVGHIRHHLEQVRRLTVDEASSL
ncbi:MAG TPA: DinB family protein [Vicinamibacterales bacterium]|nr:DinB family protein [Vicinamibacterales bacterium]